MSGPDPNYDLVGALEAPALGYVIQREQLDAAAAQYAANGYTPLTSAQTAAILLQQAQAIETVFDDDVLGVIIPPNADPYPDTLPPTYPAGLPRFPDSNPEPFDGWVEFGPEEQQVGF